MNKTVKTILSVACVAATVAAMALFAGCNPDTPAVITPSDSTPTKPTVAVPKTQMTLSDVMAINAPELIWSRLSVYEHTMNDDGTATFMVADTYGGEATLLVEFDEEKDVVTKADLTFEDLTASILTDDNFAFMPIMKAMYAKHGLA